MTLPWRGPISDGPESVNGKGVSLTDLSRRRRVGVKGSKALDWLGKHSLQASVENNQTRVTTGILVARLAPGEAVLLALEDVGNALIDEFSVVLERERPENCYFVPRQDMSAWFRLSGEQSPRLMAELCAIDLRPHRFKDGCIAQTSVAHQIAIVLRRDHQSEYGLDLIVDFSSAGYLWKILFGKVTGWPDGRTTL